VAFRRIEPKSIQQNWLWGWEEVGYHRLRVEISRSEVNEAEKGRLFEEFVKLKESEVLYGLQRDGIRLESAENSLTFEGSFCS